MVAVRVCVGVCVGVYVTREAEASWRGAGVYGQALNTHKDTSTASGNGLVAHGNNSNL